MGLQVPYKSVADMFLKRVASTPDQKALGYPVGKGEEEKIAWLNWRQVAERATAIGAGLHGLGVGHEDRVAILSNTRYEWILADLGIMCSGGANTTIYPTTESDETAFILTDSGSRVVIVEDPKQAAKIEAASLPDLTHVILIEGEAKAGTAVPQMTLADLERAGAKALAADPELIDADRRIESSPSTWPPSSTPRAPPAGPRASSCCTSAGLAGRRSGRARPDSARATCSTCGCRCPTRSARRSSAA